MNQLTKSSALSHTLPMLGILVLPSLILPINAGCQSNQHRVSHSIRSTQHIDDPIRLIHARAEIEALNPSDQIPVHIVRSFRAQTNELLTPGTVEYSRAMSSWDQIVEESLIDSPFPNVSKIEKISLRRKNEAIKLYTEARAQELVAKSRSELSVVHERYRKASELDPGSMTIHQSVARVSLLLNDLNGAHRSYLRSLELGDRSPETLIHLASFANDSDDPERVIAFVLNAQSTDHRASPIVYSIGDALLGMNAIELGYVREGAETLSRALNEFDTNARDIEWKQEIIGINGNLPSLWMIVGDAWESLGASQRADQAFELAQSKIQGPAPLSFTERRISSKLRNGYPAQGALIFLDHLETNAQDLGLQESVWAELLSQVPDIGSNLGDAIDLLHTKKQWTRSTRRLLRAIEVNALNHEKAEHRVLLASISEIDHSMMRSYFERFSNDHDRVNAARTLIDQRPELIKPINSALYQLIDNPIELMTRNIDSKNMTDELVHTSMCIAFGRVDLIEHVRTSTLESIHSRIDENPTTPWLRVHAHALALSGKREIALKLIDELRKRWSTGDEYAGRTLAETLISVQLPSEAKKITQELSDPSDASLESIELGAQLATLMGDTSSAISYLERALEQDPYDAQFYEKLITLRSGVRMGYPGNERDSSDEGKLNQQELENLVRQLSIHRPRSGVLGVLRASELARDGSTREAENLINELHSDPNSAGLGLDLLLSIWKSRSVEQENPRALEQGIEYLIGLHQNNPNSEQIVLSLAQLYYETDRVDDALDLLTRTQRRTGSFVLARSIESLYAGPSQNPEKALDLQIQRLRDVPGLDSAIELAEVYASQDSQQLSEEALDLLISRIERGIELLEPQESKLTQTMLVITRNAKTQELRSKTLDTIVNLRDLLGSSLNFELSQIELLLMSQIESIDLESMRSATISLLETTRSEEEREVLSTLQVQSLFAQERTSDGIMLAAMSAFDQGSINEPFLIDTFRVLGALGDNSDLLRVLDLIEHYGLLKESIKLTTELLGTPERGAIPDDPDHQRSDLAYTAAAMCSAFNRPEQASQFYELSLSFDPDHAWSNNDYGYMLAESGEQIDYALELLERAVNALPNESSIIDSLAWIRYKQGTFRDITNESGEIETEGAVTLLIRANELDTQRNNATILLHLGDALWRTESKVQALEAWLEGENILRSQIRLERAKTDPNMNIIESHESELTEIRHRIQDAETSGSPSLAPLADP